MIVFCCSKFGREGCKTKLINKINALVGSIDLATAIKYRKAGMQTFFLLTKMACITDLATM